MFISIGQNRWINLALCALVRIDAGVVTFSYSTGIPSTEWKEPSADEVEGLKNALAQPAPKRGYGVQMNTYRKKKTGA